MPDGPRGDLGRKVRAIRESEGLGRQAFSDLTGIPKQTLINIENCRSAPTGDHLARVCSAFEQYTLWLMTDRTIDAADQVRPSSSETPCTG